MNDATITGSTELGSDQGGRTEGTRKLGLLLFQANLGLITALTVGSTLIPALMEQVDAEAKITLSGTLTASGAVVALSAYIIFGSVSDRTRSRWGRRNPWILGGGLVAAAAL